MGTAVVDKMVDCGTAGWRAPVVDCIAAGNVGSPESQL